MAKKIRGSKVDLNNDNINETFLKAMNDVNFKFDRILPEGRLTGFSRTLNTFCATVRISKLKVPEDMIKIYINSIMANLKNYRLLNVTIIRYCTVNYRDASNDPDLAEGVKENVQFMNNENKEIGMTLINFQNAFEKYKTEVIKIMGIFRDNNLLEQIKGLYEKMEENRAKKSSSAESSTKPNTSTTSESNIVSEEHKPGLSNGDIKQSNEAIKEQPSKVEPSTKEGPSSENQVNEINPSSSKNQVNDEANPPGSDQREKALIPKEGESNTPSKADVGVNTQPPDLDNPDKTYDNEGNQSPLPQKEINQPSDRPVDFIPTTANSQSPVGAKTQDTSNTPSPTHLPGSDTQSPVGAKTQDPSNTPSPTHLPGSDTIPGIVTNQEANGDDKIKKWALGIFFGVVIVASIGAIIYYFFIRK